MLPIQAAVLTLERILSKRGSLSTLMPYYEGKLENKVPQYKDLCFGSCRWYYRIQSVLDQMTERQIKQKETRVRVILTVAIYQLLETKTPEHAVVNEAVKVARRLHKDWAKNLINGLLRSLLRQKRSLCKDDDFYRHSHGQWFLEKIKATYPEDWAKITKANNHRPPLCLRVNLRRINRDDYLDLLSKENIGAHISQHIPSAVYLTTPMSPRKTPGLYDGLVSVQDEGAQLAGYLLTLNKNDRVLDACSAPGGKAGHMLERESSIHLTALEINQGKLGKITANMSRLKVYAHLQQGDATTVDWWDGRSYNVILLDAPCSCSGVVRRHPDIKLMLDQEQVDKNCSIQMKMLQQLWQTLIPGGKLLYSTCSIFPEENEAIIERFTATCGDVVVEPIQLPEQINHHKTGNGVQLLPTTSFNDGFYFSLLSKTT